MGQVFDYAIPGQSLTKAPGSFKFEKPPHYTDESEALAALWEKLLTPMAIGNIRVLLGNGISVTEMTQTILFAGMAEGEWTPDLAFQMFQETAWMVEAIAKKSGVKGYKFKKNLPSYDKFIGEYADVLSDPTKKEERAIRSVKETVFTGIEE